MDANVSPNLFPPSFLIFDLRSPSKPERTKVHAVEAIRLGKKHSIGVAKTGLVVKIEATMVGLLICGKTDLMYVLM